jgi:hypothetical protein
MFFFYWGAISFSLALSVGIMRAIDKLESRGKGERR